jgi:hypothetical protein
VGESKPRWSPRAPAVRGARGNSRPVPVKVGALWGGSVARALGVEAGEVPARPLLAAVLGSDGRRGREIEAATGATLLVGSSGGGPGTSLDATGPPPAVAAALATLKAVTLRCATVDVSAQWGDLIASGVHASPKTLALHVNGGERLRAVEVAACAGVWTAGGGARVFLVATDAAALDTARAALDIIVRPGATIDVAAEWAGLLAGVHTPSSLRGLFLSGAGWLADIEAETGAAAWYSADASRVFLSGSERAIAAARDAIARRVAPGVTIDAGAEWGHLVASGVHSSPGAILKHLLGYGSTLAHIGHATGAAIWSCRESSRVFISGDAAQIRAARRAVDAAVTPAVHGGTIDAATAWAGAIAGGGYGSACGAVRHVIISGADALRGLRGGGALVWAAPDAARLFIAGDPRSVGRARHVIDQILAPASAPPNVAARLEAFAAGPETGIEFEGVPAAVRKQLAARALELGLALQKQQPGKLSVMRRTPVVPVAPIASAEPAPQV